MIQPGVYKHYKGKLYEVIGVAHHSETLEKLVVYKALYESNDHSYGALWVRPLDMFTGTVIVNGATVNRFELLK
ncbi:MAG: DUF1653 domain-containing protein [Bacteroidia bacterium]|jgi:hypothetical protein|nr:DUF1653 domain-containing protein [Bacteroidia bacterium]